MTATVSPRDAALWLASGEAVLIDVREPDEFRGEHIAAALSLPCGFRGHPGHHSDLIPAGVPT